MPGASGTVRGEGSNLHVVAARTSKETVNLTTSRSNGTTVSPPVEKTVPSKETQERVHRVHLENILYAEARHAPPGLFRRSINKTIFFLFFFSFFFSSEENLSNIRRVKDRENCKFKLQQTIYASPGPLHRRAPGLSMQQCVARSAAPTGPGPIDAAARCGR